MMTIRKGSDVEPKQVVDHQTTEMLSILHGISPWRRSIWDLPSGLSLMVTFPEPIIRIKRIFFEDQSLYATTKGLPPLHWFKLFEESSMPRMRKICCQWIVINPEIIKKCL